MKLIQLITVILMGVNSVTAQTPVEYRICQNCNSTNHDNANMVFQYSVDIDTFRANHVTSDFGPRDLGLDHYDWHGGIDYSSEGGDEDRGDAILAIEAGVIQDFEVASAGFKYITINSPDMIDYGYAHLFTSVSNEQRSGNFWIKLIVDGNEDESSDYALITLDTIALFRNGNELVVHPITGDTLTTTNQVQYRNAIGPIGTSFGTSASRSVAAHLHLYMFANDNFSRSDSFVKNPLCVIDHNDPFYDLELFEADEINHQHTHQTSNGNVTHSWPRFNPINEGVSLRYPGNLASSVLVRAKVDGLANEQTYDQVFNINNVKLKVSSLDNSSYEMVLGQNFRSEIDYSGCLQDDGHYPNNLINRGEANMRKSGVEAWAYSSRRQRPWDYFNFADFVTRIHIDHEIGNTTSPKISDLPRHSRYNDGNYFVQAELEDVKTFVYSSEEEEFVLDNYQPFLTSIEMFNGVNSVYRVDRRQIDIQSSINNGFLRNDIYQADLNSLANQFFSISVKASEPLDSLYFSYRLEGEVWNGAEPRILMTGSNFNQNFIWSSDFVMPEACVEFRFFANDLAGNPLMNVDSMSNQNSINIDVNIPTRLSDSTWVNLNDDHLVGHDAVHVCATPECEPIIGNGSSMKRGLQLTGNCEDLSSVNYSIDYNCSSNQYNISIIGVAANEFDVFWYNESGELLSSNLTLDTDSVGVYCYEIGNYDECCLISRCIDLGVDVQIVSNEGINIDFVNGSDSLSKRLVFSTQDIVEMNAPISYSIRNSNTGSTVNTGTLEEYSVDSLSNDLRIGENYCITYTDQFMCSFEYCFTVEGSTCPDRLIVSSSNFNNDICNQSVGGIIIEVESFDDCLLDQFVTQWSNGQTMNSISNLVAGNYCVTVTGIQECQDCYLVKCFDIIDQSCDEICSDTVSIVGATAPISICNDHDNWITRLIPGHLEYEVIGGSGNYKVNVTHALLDGVPTDLGDMGGSVVINPWRYGTYCVEVYDSLCDYSAKECFEFWRVVKPKDIPDCDRDGKNFYFRNEDNPYEPEEIESRLLADYRSLDHYVSTDGYWSLSRDYNYESNPMFILTSRKWSEPRMYLEINEQADLRTESNNEITVFPNPFANNLSVLIPNSSEGIDYTVVLLDINGKVVAKSSNLMKEQEEQFQFENMDSLTSGVYFVRVRIGQKVYTKKVIKI